MHSTKGIVACTQPLAAKCGIDILNKGGNAAVSFCSTHLLFILGCNTVDSGEELLMFGSGCRCCGWYVAHCIHLRHCLGPESDVRGV